MRARLGSLFKPLNLAGLLTIGAVALSFDRGADAGGPWRWGLLAGFAVLFLVESNLPRSWMRHGAAAAKAVVALALVWLEPRTGTSPVLLVVVVAQVAMLWPPRLVFGTALLLDAGFYLILRDAGFPRPLLVVIVYGGFQAFAALVAHYARSAEQARDALARVNADLLATRALLADSARDAERLRLARELHDVAGHKLTAMRINLRALAAEPALAGHSAVGVAEQLSAELLADIRRVVQSLRDDRGLDLATALRALSAPFPRPRLQVDIAEDVRITDPIRAEAILRLAQEALTNAARHADADSVWLAIHNEDTHVRIDITDDGQRDERIQEGNGIAGMRERLAALRGELDVQRTQAGGMQLIARLPA